MERQAPTFIGIGAQKAATSWCWRVLNEHPGVSMALPKEIEFFTRHYDRGPEWYEHHFRSAGALPRGEISPRYMDHPEVAGRIAELYPDVDLLVLLRDPRQRAISNLLHDVRDVEGTISQVTPPALQRFAESDEGYVRRSLYAAALQPFFDRFAAERIHVFFYEEMLDDAAALTQGVYAAVGADPGFLPDDVGAPVFRSKDYWSPSLFRLFQRCSQAANAWGPTRALMEQIYRTTRLRERTLRLLETDKGRPSIDFEAVFGQRAAELIDRDLESLPGIIGRALPPSWRAPEPNSFRRAS